MGRRIGNLFEFIRSIPSQILEIDNLILLLVGIAIGLAITTFIIPVAIPNAPYISEYIRPGVSCTSLAPPRGGNSRSMLALAGNDFQNLELDIRLPRTQIIQGDEITIEVMFTNNDIGPIILFMPPNSDIIQNSGAVQGVSLQIQDIVNNTTAVYSIPAGSQVLNGNFSDTDLHLLQSHERCRQTYTFQTNLGIGEYEVLATYTNTQGGVRQNIAGATLDPNFQTQGVWTTNAPLQTSSLRFSIVPPPTATPLPTQAPAPVVPPAQ